jgi:hypothetical protein
VSETGPIAMLGLFERMGSDPGIRRFKSYNPGAHGLGIRATVRRTPWVAEITGRDERYGLERDFLDYRKDYAEAALPAEEADHYRDKIAVFVHWWRERGVELPEETRITRR